MTNVNREETKARRVRLFQLICAGKTYKQIALEETISEKALAEHLKAISVNLSEWAGTEQRRTLALAIATYQRVIDEAWDAYTDARKKLDAWLAGDYDRVELHPAADGGDMREVRKPPILRLQCQEYLATIINATKELTRLAGLDKIPVELSGEVLLRRYEGSAADDV